MRRRLLITSVAALGPIVIVLGLAVWLRADLLWPPLLATDTVHVVTDTAAVQFQCVRQTREIWADVTVFSGGDCLSSSCTTITDLRASGWVNPLNGDIVIRTRVAYTYAPETSRGGLCTTDCGGRRETRQVYLGQLAPGVHQVWLGEAWLGTIEVRPPPVPADQSCLRLWYPVTPTPPPTYTPFVPAAPAYPVPGTTAGGGYP